MIQLIDGANTTAAAPKSSQARLVAGKTASLPGYNSAGQVVVDSTGIIGVSAGGAGQWLSGDIDTLVANATFNAGSALGINVDSGNSFTYGSAFTVTNAGLVKLGGGDLAITSASNTYGGATVVNAGLLHFSDCVGVWRNVVDHRQRRRRGRPRHRLHRRHVHRKDQRLRHRVHRRSALASGTGDTTQNIDFTTSGGDWTNGRRQ